MIVIMQPRDRTDPRTEQLASLIVTVGDDGDSFTIDKTRSISGSWTDGITFPINYLNNLILMAIDERSPLELDDFMEILERGYNRVAYRKVRSQITDAVREMLEGRNEQ